jgi:hypothetical protein
MNIADHLTQLEELLLDPLVRHDSALVALLLADDFLEFGASGRTFDKATILKELRNEPDRPASLLTDFSARNLSPDIVLVTYRAHRRNPAGEIISESWRSSIWGNRDQKWQITFHQGTKISSNNTDWSPPSPNQK